MRRNPLATGVPCRECPSFDRSIPSTALSSLHTNVLQVQEYRAWKLSPTTLESMELLSILSATAFGQEVVARAPSQPHQALPPAASEILREHDKEAVHFYAIPVAMRAPKIRNP